MCIATVCAIRFAEIELNTNIFDRIAVDWTIEKNNLKQKYVEKAIFHSSVWAEVGAADEI